MRLGPRTAKITSCLGISWTSIRFPAGLGNLLPAERGTGLHESACIKPSLISFILVMNREAQMKRRLREETGAS